MPDRNSELLGALDDISQEQRYLLLDSLYCEIFNLGNSLEGNREEDDLTWLSREIYLRTTGKPSFHWDNLAEDNKEFWLNVGRASIESLHWLMGRIAHRCQDYAKVLGALEKAERVEHKRRRKARR